MFRQCESRNSRAVSGKPFSIWVDMAILSAGADLTALQVFLRRQPILNSVALTLVSRAMASGEERTKLFAATAEADGEIVAAALRSDFPKMVLAAQSGDGQMADLARLVYSQMPDLPCVLGAETHVPAFVAEWSRLGGGSGRLGIPQRIHALDAVKPYREVSGALRVAGKPDLDRVLDWFRAFEMEALPEATWSGEAGRQAVTRGIESAAYFLWSDPAPVSMAGRHESGERMARIGPVYTPPEFRRRGYGGALTAAVSQKMLDSGCDACCLFTDLTNRTSNHIYAEIGYAPVADIIEYWFDGA